MLTATLLAVESQNPLIPATGELILGFLAFAVLVGLLSKAAFPAIERTYTERTDKIEGGLRRAEEAQAEAQRTLEAYQAQLADARAEAARIREDARAQGQAIIDELRTRAQEDAATITANAERQIAADRQRAFAELRGEVGRLAVELSGKIVGDALQDEGRQRAVIDSFLGDLEQREPVAR